MLSCEEKDMSNDRVKTRIVRLTASVVLLVNDCSDGVNVNELEGEEISTRWLTFRDSRETGHGRAQCFQTLLCSGALQGFLNSAVPHPKVPESAH